MDRQIAEILDVDGTLLESKSGNYYMLRVWCNDGLTTHVECHLVSPETRAKLNPLVNKELPKDYDFSQCFGITVFDYITADGE